MITIDLQDDDVTQTREPTGLERDRRRRGRDLGTNRDQNRREDELRLRAQPGLLARILRVLVKER